MDQGLLVMAWKLSEQETATGKLDVDTWAARRVISHAANTETMMGITPEECAEANSAHATHWSPQAWMLSAQVRVVALVGELLGSPGRCFTEKKRWWGCLPAAQAPRPD